MTPSVVLPDLDQDVAVDAVGAGAFGGSRQTSPARTRVIVHKSIYDRFVEGILGSAENRLVGPGVDGSDRAASHRIRTVGPARPRRTG